MRVLPSLLTLTTPYASRQMKELGLGLLLLGLLSLFLPFLGLKSMLLTWIEQWGTTVAWLIRGGITLLGLLLYLSYRNRN